MDTGLRRKGVLFCLVGPAASGKTSICSRLHGEFKKTSRISVSATSRPARSTEREGEDYYFLSREDFMKKVDRGEFFEWEEVHGNLYGTLLKTVEEAVEGGIDLLLDIDIRGALNFKDNYQHNAVAVFLVPPSFEVLRKRLVGRGTISKEEYARRVDTARREYQMLFDSLGEGLGIDYFVVNDDLEEAYKAVVSILRAERLRLKRLDLEGVRKICAIS